MIRTMTHRLFRLQSLAAVCLLITFALHAQTPEAEEDKKSPEDPIAERQSVDAFSSLEDGQPGAPGEFEAVAAVSWQNSRKALNETSGGGELRFTPQGGTFLTNMELGLGMDAGRAVVHNEQYLDRRDFMAFETGRSLAGSSLMPADIVSFLPARNFTSRVAEPVRPYANYLAGQITASPQNFSGIVNMAPISCYSIMRLL